MNKNTAKKLHEEGIKLFRKGQHDAALKRLHEALESVEANSRQMGEIFNDIGVIQIQLEDSSAADEALTNAMTCFTKLDDEKGLAQTLGNRAALYEAEGMFEESVEAYKEAAKMLEEIGEPDMAMYAWQAVSKLRMKQGQYIAAIGAYEEGVENMPAHSFKRKVLSKLLRTPGALIGGASTTKDSDEE